MLRIFLALWLAISPAYAGSMSLLGVGQPQTAAPPVGAAYSFLGIVEPDTSAVSTVVTTSFTFGAASSGRVIVMGNTVQNGQLISSIVIDPTGTPVSLTQVVTDTFTETSLWSGIDAAHAGATTVQITFATSINFNNLSFAAWQLTGLGSPTARQSNSSASGATNTISVVNTDFLFAITITNGTTGYDYSTSTVPPFATHQGVANLASAADWTITSTNASFGVVPKAGVGPVQSAATWR
jgi:hypothetical protein